MSLIEAQETVGSLVARHPGLSRVFEEIGIDYCCGGKRPLLEVCREKGWDPAGLIEKLEQSAAERDTHGVVDAAAMPLSELADHIEQTHHAYLRGEFPRLDALTEKVARVHGDHDSRLREVRQTYVQFAQELSDHMLKEEQILFPRIRLLAADPSAPIIHPGFIADPIDQMEQEHHEAGDALERLHTLTDGYTPPPWACNTYRALLDALAHLERDMHQHVHKEDNVLFPAAIALSQSQPDKEQT